MIRIVLENGTIQLHTDVGEHDWTERTLDRETAERLHAELGTALGYQSVHPIEISVGFEAQTWDSEAVIKARQHEAL